MRIRKQQVQRDLMMPPAGFTSGLHLLAAATGAVASRHHAALLQLQTIGGVDEEQALEDEKKFCYRGSESEVQVKVEGEASSSVSHDLDCKRIFRQQGRRSQIAVESDSMKLHKLGKMEISNTILRLSPKASDSSDLDTRSSLQQQKLQFSSGSFSQKTQLINNGNSSSSSSSAEKGNTGTPKRKGSWRRDQCTKRKINGAKARIYDTVQILDTSSCPDDPFPVDAEPDSKKLKALQQEKLRNFFPQSTQQRSNRKQRVTLKTEGDENSGVCAEQSSMLSQLQAQVKPSTPLPPDHPSNHSKESLLHSVYQVFLQAGKAGLTAREAASRVVEQSFPGLHQGGVTARAQVGKLLGSSPFFMELEEGRFALFSAIIHSNEEDLGKLEAEQPPKKVRTKGTGTSTSPLHTVEVDGMPVDFKMDVDKSCPEKKVVQQKKSKRKLIRLAQEGVVGLGEQCKRTDGKSWRCPLHARLGYQLCDYHLDKLRTKLPTNPPRKPNPTIVIKQQKSIRPTPDDSWLVPKKSVWGGHNHHLLEALD